MNIPAGDIGNALHSVAPEHVVAITSDIYDQTMSLYQDEINQQLSSSTVNLSSSVANALDTKLPKSGGTVSGDLTVTGNFIVNGTSSIINTQDLAVKDRLILLASGSTSTASADGAGIAIQTASAATTTNAEKSSARIQYVGATNRFTSSVDFQAPNIIGNLSGTATSASQAENANKLGGKAASQYASASHTHAYTTAAQVTASINALVSASGSAWAANTKVTSVGNHYTPAEDTASVLTASASGATAAWSIDVVKGVTVKRDTKGHVVGVTVTSGKVPGNPNTDRYVATASFASTGSNGANGVKMTLTRQGSDTTAVTATIPVASTTTAGVMTGAQVTKLNNAESKPLSIYHPNTGCLVTTNLTTASSVMVDFLVEGNGYSGNYPILSQIQTYYYITGSTKSFQQSKGTNYGSALGTPKVFALNTGYIALWFTQPSSYCTIRVVAHKNSESPAADHVSTITNGAAPTAFSTTASVTMQTKPSSDSSTTYAGHFAPSSSGAGTSGSSTARYYIKTISVDGKGHIVGVTTGNETVTNTDTKVTAVGNHYTPAQSTAKSVSSGQAVFGIGLDAAGHVTSVTGSSTITSASRAVSAASADVATKATMIDSASNQVVYDPTAECFRFIFA